MIWELLVIPILVIGVFMLIWNIQKGRGVRSIETGKKTAKYSLDDRGTEEEDVEK